MRVCVWVSAASVCVCVCGQGVSKLLKRSKVVKGHISQELTQLSSCLSFRSPRPTPCPAVCIEIDGKFIRSVFGLKVEEKI